MSTLKVGTIQDHANSNTAISIDSSGRVTTPARPAFLVGLNNTYTHTSGNIIQYNDISNQGFNTGNHFDLTNHKFVVPINGLYQFHASTSIASGEYSRSANIRMHINDTNIDSRFGARGNLDGDRSGGSSYLGLRGLWIINLTAGQEITWKSSWETDGNMDSTESMHYHGTYCWGMLVG
jgi:hypothetical protein